MRAPGEKQRPHHNVLHMPSQAYVSQQTATHAVSPPCAHHHCGSPFYSFFSLAVINPLLPGLLHTSRGSHSRQYAGFFIQSIYSFLAGLLFQTWLSNMPKTKTLAHPCESVAQLCEHDGNTLPEKQ
jgi:hypothetical protein